jgi:hypothetical protein
VNGRYARLFGKGAFSSFFPDIPSLSSDLTCSKNELNLISTPDCSLSQTKRRELGQPPRGSRWKLFLIEIGQCPKEEKKKVILQLKKNSFFSYFLDNWPFQFRKVSREHRVEVCPCSPASFGNENLSGKN